MSFDAEPDSGSASTWDRVPLRYLVTTHAGGTPTSTSSIYWDDNEGVPWLSIADMDTVDASAPHGGRYLTDEGVAISRLIPSCGEMVLFAMYASVGEVAFLRSSAVWSQAILGLKPRSGVITSRFLYWALMEIGPMLPQYFRSNTQNNLNAEQVRALRIPWPPLTVQRAIADFLDRETAQIDAFIAKNEQLIALLTERRAAVIARAVTKGLRPDVEMKSSGLAWFGDIPAHWQVSKLSRWHAVTLGKMLDASKFGSAIGPTLPYIRAANVRPGRLDLTSVNQMPFSAQEQRKFELRRGDLLVVEGGSIGVNVVLKEDMEGWGFQKTVNRVRPLSDASAAFAGLQLDVMRAGGVIDMMANVSTILHFTAEKLEGTPLAMPPPDEQFEIVEYVAKRTVTIDSAIGRALRVIELARERRAALISAAVTGKIDVGVDA